MIKEKAFQNKLNIEEFKKLQKQVIKKYIVFIRHLMAFSDETYKKAAQIVVWLSRYADYIRLEDNFLPRRYIQYRRGQIIFVNFGFRVGNEFGGPHYGIILDVKNSRKTATVTVCPLKSYKGNVSKYSDIYCVNLGKIDGLEKESLADCGQIVTISKLRIINPCKPKDSLCNVILSSDKMKLVDNKIHKLYFCIDNENPIG